jgi:hypothetical protein
MVRNLVHVRRESATGAAQNTDRGVFPGNVLCGFAHVGVWRLFPPAQRQRDEYY